MKKTLLYSDYKIYCSQIDKQKNALQGNDF